MVLHLARVSEQVAAARGLPVMVLMVVQVGIQYCHHLLMELLDLLHQLQYTDTLLVVVVGRDHLILLLELVVLVEVLQAVLHLRPTHPLQV